MDTSNGCKATIGGTMGAVVLFLLLVCYTTVFCYLIYFFLKKKGDSDCPLSCSPWCSTQFLGSPSLLPSSPRKYEQTGLSCVCVVYYCIQLHCMFLPERKSRMRSTSVPSMPCFHLLYPSHQRRFRLPLCLILPGEARHF
jgi:hypothetical protein